MLQVGFAVLLLTIFLTFFLTSKNERYAADLNEVIKAAEGEAKSMESAVKARFEIESVAKAIEALREAKSDMIALILFLTTGAGEE